MDSIISWMGGKKLLRKKISGMVPDDIVNYVEPFGGAGWVLLYRERWAELEVWNDLNNDLYNVFMQIKFHPDALSKEMELMLHSRRLFKQMLKREPLTEIQRAARFIYLIRHSFGSQGGSFGTGRTGGGGSGMQLPIDRIWQLTKRLDRVVIENLDYADILERYDHKDGFMYIDPPYVQGKTYDNAKKFSHIELAERLKALKCRWILSYDDDVLVRTLYAGYELQEVTRRKGINGKAEDLTYKELIVKNF